jgi:hypothetical protein
VLQEGWINTAPGGDEPCLPVTVDGARHGGGYDPDLSFGNTYGVEPPPQDLVSIEVFKYHDRNRNARFDPGEPGLNGWRIVLFDAQEQQVASAFTQDHPQTGAAGWVRFENLPAADYFICEKLQRGWVNTDPGGAFPCKHGNATTGSQTITGADGSERADAVTITVDDDRASAYRVTLISDTGNTWTYLVEELGGRDLSHWNLGLGECLEHLAGSTPGAETGNDGSTGFYGIKWNVGDGFSSGEFSITLDGSYAAATIDVLVKAGNGFATAAITGPDCSDGGNGADQQQDITIHLGNSRRDY